IFVTASAACGAATSLPMLVAFRVVQAAGAALLTPTSLGLILATTPPERRHGAVRGWTAVGGLAAAAGPVVGGLLVAASWRWVFLVNVPIGLAALAFGWWRRPFTGASTVAVFFSAAFGAMLLSRVLWMQDVWHWSALSTGLGIAPGPLMVPLFSFVVAGPLIARFGPGAVIAAGSTIFAAGV